MQASWTYLALTRLMCRSKNMLNTTEKKNEHILTIYSCFESNKTKDKILFEKRNTP